MKTKFLSLRIWKALNNKKNKKAYVESKKTEERQFYFQISQDSTKSSRSYRMTVQMVIKVKRQERNTEQTNVFVLHLIRLPLLDNKTYNPMWRTFLGCFVCPHFYIYAM